MTEVWAYWAWGMLRFGALLGLFLDSVAHIGELGYDGPLCDRLLSMTYDMLGPSPMHIKYVSHVHDRFCIGQTYFSRSH